MRYLILALLFIPMPARADNDAFTNAVGFVQDIVTYDGTDDD